MSQETKRFEFGDYVLDGGERVLLRDGRSIPIPPKILELLLVLVENQGRIVEKEELMKRLWADTFVEESNLTFSIRKLRKILGDETQNPRFIETIPKRGYRFIGVDSKNRSGDQYLANTDLGDFGFVNNAGDRPSHGERSISWHRYIWPAGISILLLAESLFLFWWVLGNRSSPLSSVKVERLTYNGKTKLAAISPDGKFVAYVTDDEGAQGIWLKNVTAEGDVQILPVAEDTMLYSLTFSPDGNYIYYVAKDTLYQLPILGGMPKEIIKTFGVGSQYKSFTLSPDGKQLAFIRPVSEESVVVIVNSDGSGERILTSSKGRGLFRRSIAWSPDGKDIALVAAAAQGITIIRVADGAISSIPSPPWTDISRIAWQPESVGFFVVATEGRSLSYQIWSLSYPDGKAENITNDFDNYQTISSTADGRTIAAVRVEQAAHVWATSGEQGQLRQLTQGIAGYDGINGLDYLSNGDIIYEATAGEKGQIWKIGSDGAPPKQIIDDSASSGASPDGKYIVFQGSDDSKVVGLYRYDVDSGEKIRLTTGRDIWIEFSPDAKWVIFTHWEGDATLWKVSIDGGKPEQLATLPGYALAPAVSLDGKLIAFHWLKRNLRVSPEIAVIPFEGGNVIKSFPLPDQYWRGVVKAALQWAPDGQAIDYAVFRDNASNIWRQLIDGSPAFQVTNFTDQQIFNFAYTPDGKKLVLSRGTYARDAVLLKLPSQ